jgi:hypothetical protein
VHDRERGSLLRTFEWILGLDSGYLVPEATMGNRSLSVADVELVRRLNVEFHDRQWPDEAYHLTMRLGVVKHLLTSEVSGANERRMSTPRWALDRACEIGAYAAARIGRSGVLVVGDLSTLAEFPSDPADIRDEGEPTPWLPPSPATSIEAVLGAIVGSRLTEPAIGNQRQISDVTSGELARIVLGRARRRLGPSSSR